VRASPKAAHSNDRIPVHQLVVLVYERLLADRQCVRMAHGISACNRTHCIPNHSRCNPRSERPLISRPGTAWIFAVADHGGTGRNSLALLGSNDWHLGSGSVRLLPHGTSGVTGTLEPGPALLTGACQANLFLFTGSRELHAGPSAVSNDPRFRLGCRASAANSRQRGRNNRNRSTAA
jgi:hypothetical protein